MSTPLSKVSGRVKEARRLTRRRERAQRGLFLAEGDNGVREALTTPGCVVEVFATCAATTRHHGLYADAIDAGAAWHLADDAALASLSETVTPPGLVAVCRSLDVTLAEILAVAPRLVAVCVDVRDPGNAGTVVRTADAAGAGGVVFAGDSVDPYNGKTVRASAGSLFHLPLVVGAAPADAIGALRDAGLRVLAADGAGERDLDDLADSGALAVPTAWVFGNEAHGLPEEIAGLADDRVRIVIHGRAESLNLSSAAAVCLYASARAQR